MARIAFRLPTEISKLGGSFGIAAGIFGVLALIVVVLQMPLRFAGYSGREYQVAPREVLFQAVAARQQDAAAYLNGARLVAAAIPGDALPELRLPGTMLIRTGTIELRVDGLAGALARAESLAARLGGLVVGSTAQAPEGNLGSASLTVHVPSGAFDRLVHGLGRLGAVEHLQVSTEDVGEEYVDVEARLANARRLESRLITLLATRAGRLTDVLAVERELARVREGAELLEGRRRYLAAHTAMSSLEVRMVLPSPVGAAAPGMFRQAAEDAWRSFQWLVAFGIRCSGVVLPLAALTLLGWGVRRRFTTA